MAGGSVNGVGARVVKLFVLRVDPWQEDRKQLGGKLSKMDTFRRNLGSVASGD